MRDKELEEIGRVLFPAARHLVLTSPDNPRAATVERLLRAVPVPPSSSTIALAPSSRDAMAVARTHTPAGGLVCVTGSLYLVGEVKSQLESNAGESPEMSEAASESKRLWRTAIDRKSVV